MEQAAFEAHPLWGVLQQLGDRVQELDQSADEDAAPKLAQLRFLVGALREHNDPLDTLPYSATTLTGIQSHVNNALQAVNQYGSNKSIAHLSTAVDHADKAQHTLGLLPPVPKSSTAAQTSRTFLEFRNMAEEAIDNLRRRNDELDRQLVEREQEHGEQQQQAQQRLKELTQAAADLKQQIASDEARLDSALTDANERFTDKQTQREEKFENWLDEQGSALEGLASAHITKLKELQGEGQEVFNALNELRDGTENVAALATGDALAGHYAKYARAQWISGLAATALGFLGLVTGALVIIWTVRDIGPTETISWQFTALKVGLTLTVVGGGAVAIRIGTNFLARSHFSKELELELRAIGPFLADVDETKAQDTKTAFIERRFGQSPINNATHGDANTINVTAFDHLVTAAQRLSGGQS